MSRGYKLPKGVSPRATMRAAKPKDSSLMSSAPKTTSKIPEIRPVSKRNLKSAPGFKPGSY